MSKVCAGPTSWVKTDHWVCAECDTEMVGQQNCPNCNSENTFPKNDNSWPCANPRCQVRAVNHSSRYKMYCLACIEEDGLGRKGRS